MDGEGFMRKLSPSPSLLTVGWKAGWCGDRNRVWQAENVPGERTGFSTCMRSRHAGTSTLANKNAAKAIKGEAFGQIGLGGFHMQGRVRMRGW